MPSEIAAYAKQYRASLGFGNQGDAKDFLQGRDIKPGVDHAYLSNLNGRVRDVITKVNSVVHRCLALDARGLQRFLATNVDAPHTQITESGILMRLNNQGRRPEQVYYSWMRGFAIASFFRGSLARIFAVPPGSICQIGEDDWTSPETFRRAPTPDMQITTPHGKVRVEVQSGFQGINDIKEHKVREARRHFQESGEPTVCMHFDIYNGLAAMVRLDTVDGSDVHWITRQQMEGQTVFEIDQNNFAWRITDLPPTLEDMDIQLI